MSYTVLARRYRSRDFDELVGQEPIARTLKNAIAAGRTAHAYLFCGTRGVGKTSLARIFAKAMNVTDELTQADAVGDAIMRGDDLDVIEIDGASNRGINEARDLIAGAGLSPARCPYKIYIIDEVHQITKDAFNALLKTMEEPPSHVKFILCTTDPQKVPATIQSRCQRFDFRAIPTSKIAGHLKTILTAEGIEADEALIMHIARLGNGSMRDALSLLDRLLASGEAALSPDTAREMLGLPDTTLIADLVGHVAQGDTTSALNTAAEILQRGTSVEQTMDLLAEHFRSLMIILACGSDSPLLEMTSESVEQATAQATHFDIPGLVHMIAMCDAVGRNARSSAIARTLLEAAIVRLCMAEHFADIATLLKDGGTATRSASPAPAGRKKKATKPPEVEQLAPPAPPPASTRQVERKPEVAVPPPTDGPSLWAAILTLSRRNDNDRMLLEHYELVSFDAGVLGVRITNGGAAATRIYREKAVRLEALAREAWGSRVAVQVEESAPGAPASAGRAGSLTLEEAMEIPLVKSAADLFDAVVMDARTDEAAEHSKHV